MNAHLYTAAGKALLEREYGELARSSYAIAKELGTYPNDVVRALHAHSIPVRDRSSAQKRAIESGRHKHPTRGVPRGSVTRGAIGRAVSESWASGRAGRMEAARKRWEALPEASRGAFRAGSNAGLRLAASRGSKLEHAIAGRLRTLGHRVHRRHAVAGVRADLFLPERNVAIRVDGPAHLLPIYGEARLARVAAADDAENASLAAAGVSVVRVRWSGRSVSGVRLGRLLQSLESVLDSIKCVNEKPIDLEII